METVWCTASAYPSRFSKNEGHTCPVSVSEPGFEPGLRDSESRVLPIRRFRNCCRSGGNCTRAARSKSPACRFNTSDREVGPEGVKPSPHRVKAGHASLHFDPVLLSLERAFAFAFAFHGHTSSTHRLTISEHTSRTERISPLHTPLPSSALPRFTHLSWARLESHRAKLGTEHLRLCRKRRTPTSHYGPAFTAPVASRRRSPGP